MAIIVLCWLCLTIYGMKYTKQKNAFEQKQVIALRGICSVEIMLGHLGIATGSIILFPNRKAGILFVGIFFALSGYGLMYSISNKESYLEGFWKKRIPKILVPAYAVFLIEIVIKSIIAGDAYNLVNVISIKKFFEQTNWYVWELLAMYIVFYICAKIDRSLLKSQYILLVLSLAFIGIAYRMDLDNPWYGSTLCFWLGIFYYLKSEMFIQFSTKHFWQKIVIGCMLLGIFCTIFFIRGGGILGSIVARNCASMVFTISVIIWLYKFSIGNRLSVWLGKYSYEIFLFHPLLISTLRPFIRNDVFYATMVIVGTILTAFIYRNCANFTKGLCKRQELRG